MTQILDGFIGVGALAKSRAKALSDKGYHVENLLQPILSTVVKNLEKEIEVYK